MKKSCPNCGKMFANIQGLTIHQRRWCKSEKETTLKEKGTSKTYAFGGGDSDGELGTQPKQQSPCTAAPYSLFSPEIAIIVSEAWRAIIGLPKEFEITPMQITVCVAAANSMLFHSTKN